MLCSSRAAVDRQHSGDLPADDDVDEDSCRRMKIKIRSHLLAFCRDVFYIGKLNRGFTAYLFAFFFKNFLRVSSINQLEVNIVYRLLRMLCV